MIVRKKDDNDQFTVMDYLSGKVKFGVTQNSLRAHLADRGLAPDILYEDCDRNVLRLCYADVLKWFVLGASKVNNTTDSDNGWSHAGGGYELSDNDINALKAEANAIYEELEPESVLKKKSTFKITSHGVKCANINLDGTPLPHINR